MKLLFICKKRHTYDTNSGFQDHVADKCNGSYGVTNSCNLVKQYFDAVVRNPHEEIECKVVTVADNNCIDREVFNYKPTHVFIEALWVVPAKFLELLPLHPNVKWAVRIHSATPFLANEGIAFEWINDYLQIADYFDNFSIAGNDREFVEELRSLNRLASEYIEYLPNLYFGDFGFKTPKKTDYGPELHIGCFGAIRPMKNQLQQAVAAVMLANELGKRLYFHMNGRAEQNGDQVLKNIQALMKSNGNELVLHGWHTHEDFIKLVATMDAGLQVSLSETFNIVAADFVMQNIPIVVSPEIKWASHLYTANPNNANDIRAKLSRALYWRSRNLQHCNKVGLRNYNHKALQAWMNYLNP